MAEAFAEWALVGRMDVGAVPAEVEGFDEGDARQLGGGAAMFDWPEQSQTSPTGRSCRSCRSCRPCRIGRSLSARMARSRPSAEAARSGRVIRHFPWASAMLRAVSVSN